MKRTIYVAVLFLLIGITAISCKKVSATVDLSNTKWIGTLTTAGDVKVYDSTVIQFNGNGTLDGTIAKKGAAKSYVMNGTWDKASNSNKVYMHHTIASASGTFEAVANLNSDNTKLEGGVGVSSFSSDGDYTYSLTKM